MVKNKIIGAKNITGEIQKDTADINTDNKISAIDYVLIKNDILNLKKIDIR